MQLTGFVAKEGDMWVSYCKELDISSCGDTEEKAQENILEAIQLFFDSCIERGVLDEALRNLGWKCDDEQAATINACREGSIPKNTTPAYMIDALEKHGRDWSMPVSFGN